MGAIHLVPRPHSTLASVPTAVYGKRDPAEIQAFEFFVSRVIPGMTRLVDTDFWHKFVLQASQVDDAVWNATNSMANLIRQLHPSSRTDDDFDDYMDNCKTERFAVAGRQTALLWYARSIDEVRARMRSEMTWSSVYSITAVLYMCIECLLGNIKGALSIYRKAMHIMRISTGSSDIDTVDKNDPVRSSVMALFRHITVAHGFQVAANPEIQQSLKTSSMSLVDMRDTLYTLVSECYEFVYRVELAKRHYPKNWLPPADLILQRDSVLHRLRKWASIASTMHDNISRSEHALAFYCMYLAQSVFVIWMSTVLSMFETAFDEYEPIFQTILNHAEAAINAHGTNQPLFSFETRVISPLTFVATRCRHPTMRRRAIQLLRRGPHIENTQHAMAVISMAKRIIAIEESGCADGAWLPNLPSLHRPPEVHRLAWAELDRNGPLNQCLLFGRWQLTPNNEWYLTSEMAKI